MTYKLLQIPSESGNHPDLENGEYTAEEIQAEFIYLASQWVQSVEGMSSTVEMAKHPDLSKNCEDGKSCSAFLIRRFTPKSALLATRFTPNHPTKPSTARTTG